MAGLRFALVKRRRGGAGLAGCPAAGEICRAAAGAFPGAHGRRLGVQVAWLTALRRVGRPVTAPRGTRAPADAAISGSAACVAVVRWHQAGACAREPFRTVAGILASSM